MSVRKCWITFLMKLSEAKTGDSQSPVLLNNLTLVSDFLVISYYYVSARYEHIYDFNNQDRRAYSRISIHK